MSTAVIAAPEPPAVLPSGLIQVSKPYLESLPLTDTEREILATKTACRSLCPAIWFFEAGPDVRKILRMEARS